MRKYATLDILDARVATRQDTRLMKNSHRVSFDYEPRPGFLYVRSRMISSRCNDNYDEFPADQIKLGWKTFVGKPVFVNHHNADHRKARGVIIDAALHEDKNPDGSPDTWVEGLMEVDAMTYPKLAKALVAGHIERTSMGVDVDYSVCSKCGNKAQTPLDYCQHIPTMKGMKAAVKTASGAVRNEIIREKCYGLRFFENSLLVEEPADPTAYFLGKVEQGPGLEHLAVTAKAKQFSPGHFDSGADKGETCSRWHCDNPAVATHSIDGGKSTLHVCKTHKNEMDSSKNDNGSFKESSMRCQACFSREVFQFQGSSECLDCGHVHTAGMVVHAAREERPLSHNPHSAANFAKLARTEATRPQKPLVPKTPVKNMAKGSPELAEWNGQVKAHAQEWHKRNPISHKNIIDHWDAGTDHEHEAGMTWYSDAHETAKHIANDTGHDVHKVADLISNYSPQTHWATNITTSAKVARTRVPSGGKNNKDGIPDVHPETGQVTPKGIMASDQQRNTAQKILDGEHRDTTLKGPKTHAFAHLIAHGGNSPEDQAAGRQRVCVDRHALSVAAGARASDAAYGHSGLAGKKRYQQAEDAFTKAARIISKREGRPVEAHQVQAATWLTRQRLNEEGDRESVSKGSSSASAAQASIRKMHEYMGEHHPEASLQMPGTGYSQSNEPNKLERIDNGEHPSHTAHGSRLPFAQGSSRLAYGEVKAPPDVDTLRDEECPICGEQDSYDGTECKVCGYVEPPQQFQDPNVDKAKQLDLRKDTSDPAQMDGQDIGHLEDSLADPDRDGFDDETGEAIDPNDPTGGDGPMLECPACGSEFEPAPPQTVSTDAQEAELGEMDSGGDPGAPAPAEGDICPVCGKGELLSSGEAQALGEEGPPPMEEGEAPDEMRTPEPGEDEEPEEDDEEGFLQKDDADDPDDEEDDDDSSEDDDAPVKKSKNPFK